MKFFVKFVKAVFCSVFLLGSHISAQDLPTADPVLNKIWEAGNQSNQTRIMAQTLLDSLGPRLTGTPNYDRAADWAVKQLTSWGYSAKMVQYGTWKGWTRGHTHVDLIEPRVRTLDATMMAWSPGTKGKDVDALVVGLPAFATVTELDSWLKRDGVKNKAVLVSLAQPTCRPDADWQMWATKGVFERMDSARTRSQNDWKKQMAAYGLTPAQLAEKLEAAGAKALLTSLWSKGWGVEKIFGANTKKIPSLSLSCEDYGLLSRLAENNQGPKIRINASSTDHGNRPVYNVIAELKGSEKPEEYVVLSAHFDSWDGGSGATDNGTGSVTMLEAARLLREFYPNPKRTIIIGLWGGEEQGLNGSRAFTEDRPEVVAGLQALFNQDNGTGQVSTISGQGLLHAGEFIGRWFSQLPELFSNQVSLRFPGTPSSGGSDHAAFVCAGAPGFILSSSSWNYGTYTWHTNRDTYDKISFDDLRDNAVLTAMLTYLASEEEQTIPRERRMLKGEWPKCGKANRGKESK